MVLQTGEQGLVRARREPKYKAKKVYLRNHNMCFFTCSLRTPKTNVVELPPTASKKPQSLPCHRQYHLATVGRVLSLMLLLSHLPLRSTHRLAVQSVAAMDVPVDQNSMVSCDDTVLAACNLNDGG